MENKDDLIKLFIDLAESSKFSALLLEKDYHLTRILHKIVEKQIHDLVFKGGTCLNKCYLDFYRLSEDLDFIYNKDVKSFSKSQVKKKLDELRREFFEILGNLDLKTSNKLGEGWEMLTSKQPPNIIGLIINTSYVSFINNIRQNIKIEISFRKKLTMPTKRRKIQHKFIDALGEPVLKKEVKIEAIDLVENFAEKFRALVTRKQIAARDIYDIHFILTNEILAIDKEIIEMIVMKINESRRFTKHELDEFIKALHTKIGSLDDKEIKAVIKSDEKIDIKKMTELIIKEFNF